MTLSGLLRPLPEEKAEAYAARGWRCANAECVPLAFQTQLVLSPAKHTESADQAVSRATVRTSRIASSLDRMRLKRSIVPTSNVARMVAVLSG